MERIFKIPMQFFADESETVSEETVSETETAQGEAETAPAPAEKTFTQEEVNKLISERLARQQKQFDAKQEEAAKLAKMNAEEKAKYAAQKREEELKAREAEIQKKELRYEALNILEEKKLPAKLIDCINLESAETSKASIEAINTAWSEALTAAVNERLKSNPPAYSNGNTPRNAFLEGFMEG